MRVSDSWNTLIILASLSIFVRVRMEEKDSESLLLESRSAPWLVFIHEDFKENPQIFFSVSEGRHFTKNIHEMQLEYCWSTPRGWLLIMDLFLSACFLLNPVTMDKVELPFLESTPSNTDTTCIMSSHPADPSCMVMFIDIPQHCLFFCRPADTEWVRYKSNLDAFSDFVACNGKFYALINHMELAIIEFAPNPKLRILETKCPKIWKKSFTCVGFLVQSCGELFVVRMYFLEASRKPIDIVVFKMDFSKRAWEVVDSIGDQVFFYCGYARSWCASELSIKGDCIYFSKIDDSKCLWVYDLVEGTISVDMPCPNLDSHWYQAFWLMPTV